MIAEYHPIYDSCNQREVNTDSNTPRLYSQWLHSVISLLINHCTDWHDVSRSTLIPVDINFHDVIYYIWHCNVDNMRCNVVFTTT